MADIKKIYDETFQHSHDAALSAVFAAGVEEGKALGTVREITVDMDTSGFESEIQSLKDQVETLTKANNEGRNHVAELNATIDELEAKISDLTKNANTVGTEQQPGGGGAGTDGKVQAS